MKRRTLCRTVLLVSLAVVFCTPVFLPVSHAHDDAHDCLACSVCIAASRLQALLLVLFVALALLRMTLPVCMRVQHAARRRKRMPGDTLVGLNIRMNN